MGNRHPAPVQQTTAPRSFFLVVGGPSIRYIRDPPARGPLIFDVETEQPDDNESVQRAETVQLQVAVPSRQSFKLKQVNPGNKNFGFLLSFSLGMIKPGKMLRVLAGVDIEYVPGEGVQLMQSKKSQNPFCVYEVVHPEDFEEEIEVSEVLHLEKLSHTAMSADESGAKRLTYAPIVIELMYEVTVETETTTTSSQEDVYENLSERETLVDHMQSTSSHSTTPSPSVATNIGVHTMRIVQYTFLDFPDAALERTALTSFLRDENGNNADRPVYEAKVARQLLQRGTEVYELDDVFDLGACDDISDEMDEAEAEEAGLCVICLTNPKDTILLPCRHMCLCHDCVAVLLLQPNNRCPVCRSAIARHMTA
ncbi:zinc finger family protein [Trypanosoma theileri]|uniref:Zinc finger family protein n=1 Tax=Trypanosoma theileri TaxID=67003 RepID=A0A1X0NRX0_9TRYP|nr:zinc finger family protein [Trypanosoma theileri]ORC86929.1 zinc finger family protein [Trypanosoma theileri]